MICHGRKKWLYQRFVFLRVRQGVASNGTFCCCCCSSFFSCALVSFISCVSVHTWSTSCVPCRHVPKINSCQQTPLRTTIQEGTKLFSTFFFALFVFLLHSRKKKYHFMHLFFATDPGRSATRVQSVHQRNPKRKKACTTAKHHTYSAGGRNTYM